MNEIDLSGLWNYQIDENDIGIKEKFYSDNLCETGFKLPGTTCENNIGKIQTNYDEMTKDTVRCLRMHHDYNGVIWLQRKINIPFEWEDKEIYLYMERVMWFSDVWVDDKKIDRQIDSLCTPHIYKLTGCERGEHMLTMRIDNRNLYNLDNMASGFTNDTQSVWNGVIGEIKLYKKDKYNISNVQVYPDIKYSKISVQITVDTSLIGYNSVENIDISLEVVGMAKTDYNVNVHHTRQIVYLEYDMDKDIKLWDEFNPYLYTLKVCLKHDDNIDEEIVSFGMREIKADGRHFMLNGKRIFLRGTLDCCVYPKTGYPPTDLNHWLKVCKTAKEYGLNHIRFHSWCPPEAAFKAADVTGIYILAEMTLWLNRDVCALATGDDPIHSEFFLKEAQRISKFYGNHPSFIMFSNGNELLGDFEMLENLTTQIKALDNRRLYTLTSNFDRNVTPADDYFSAFRADGHGIRCQYFHKKLTRDTYLDFDDGIMSKNVPTVSFEVGQYCVYPNVNDINKYDGNLMPVNFAVIRDDLEKKNLLHKVNDFVFASGKLAALLYKEDIEASLRTKEMGGIELLGIHDYTGQCTATVGVLDAFWESKGIISGDEFRQFCSPVVPLLKTKRMYQNTDTFIADFDIADFGENKIKDVEYVLKFYNGEELIYNTKSKNSHIEFPLEFISASMHIKVVLSVNEYSNSWDIFVYSPVKEVQNTVLITDSITDEVIDKIENGGKVYINANKETLKKQIQGKFYPVFWSPAYFPSSNPCGFMCENENGVFDEFPTEKTSNYQWHIPLDNSMSIDISKLPIDFTPTLELVPNFFDNTRMAAILEARIGKADILFTAFDFGVDNMEVKQLEYSIKSYINSEKFAPTQKVDFEVIQNLFK